MKEIFEKYNSEELYIHLKQHGYNKGNLNSYVKGYSVPRPKLLRIICLCIALAHNKELDVILFESIISIEKNDMYRSI